MKEKLQAMESYWVEVFAKVASSGQPASYENHTKSLDRVLSIWVFVPKPGYLGVVFSDNTARRRAEVAVFLAQEQLQHIVDNVKDVIFRIDLQGNYIYANDSVIGLTGYSSDKILKMNGAGCSRASRDGF